MDRGDDLEGDQRVFERKPRQHAIAQRAGRAEAGDGAEEIAAFAGVVIDLENQAFAGRAQAEVEGQIDVGEGRDVEVLGHAPVENRLAGGSVFQSGGAEHVGFGFAKGVGHFREGGVGAAGGGRDEVERDGVELVAEHARQGEQQHAGAGAGIEAFGGEAGEHAGFERGEGRGRGARSYGRGRVVQGLVGRQVVGLAKRE